MSYLYDGKSFNVLSEGLDTIGQSTSNRWRGNRDRTFNPTSEYLYTNGKAVVRTDVTSKNHSFINRHSGWQHSKNYYTQDNLGSIIGIMDSNGHVDEKYGYDAFGKLVEGRFDYVNKLGYNGKMYDNYSGLVNYGFRDYSPISMRFTTVDPIKDSFNWYSYVGNDPINFIDPFGLSPSDNQTVSDLPFSLGIDPNLTGTVIRGEFVSLSFVARVVMGEGTAYEYDDGSLVDQYEVSTFSIGFETNAGAEVGKYQSVYKGATKVDILGPSSSGDAQAGYIASASVSSDVTSTGKSSTTVTTTLGASALPVGVGYNLNLTSEKNDSSDLTAKDRSFYYNQYYNGE